MEPILELLLAHLPIVSSALIVPLIRKLKNKIKSDLPVVWWGISIATSIGLALGGSELVGASEATAQLNAVMTALLTQAIHTLQKTAKKLKE